MTARFTTRELTALADYADDQTARLVWSVNYTRGWRYAEGSKHKLQEVTLDIEGVEASDAEEEADDDRLTWEEKDHLALLYHGMGYDLAGEEGGLIQAEVEQRALAEIRDSNLLAPFIDDTYVRNLLVLNFWRGYQFQRNQGCDYEKPLVDGQEVF